MQRHDRARGIRGSLLILLGSVVGVASFGTWAVRTYDFGMRQAVEGMDVGGPIMLALAVIIVGAAIGSLLGGVATRAVALVAGTVGFVYAIVRAAQLGAEDIPLGYTTEVARVLWTAITASALTISVALVGAEFSSRARSRCRAGRLRLAQSRGFSISSSDTSGPVSCIT